MGALIISTVCLWGALVFCLGLLSRKTFDHSSEGVAPPPKALMYLWTLEAKLIL